jgi:hypothetical protein
MAWSGRARRNGSAISLLHLGSPPEPIGETLAAAPGAGLGADIVGYRTDAWGDDGVSLGAAIERGVTAVFCPAR